MIAEYDVLPMGQPSMQLGVEQGGYGRAGDERVAHGRGASTMTPSCGVSTGPIPAA